MSIGSSQEFYFRYYLNIVLPLDLQKLVRPDASQFPKCIWDFFGQFFATSGSPIYLKYHVFSLLRDSTTYTPFPE